MSAVIFKIRKHYESENVVEGRILAKTTYMKEFYYLEYSNLQLQTLTKLCKILGFDDLHSLHRKEFLNETQSKLFFLSDFYAPYDFL